MTPMSPETSTPARRPTMTTAAKSPKTPPDAPTTGVHASGPSTPRASANPSAPPTTLRRKVARKRPAPTAGSSERPIATRAKRLNPM